PSTRGRRLSLLFCDLADDMLLPTAHRDLLLATAQYGKPLPFGLAAAALEAADCGARNEAVAMHADEAVRMLLLESRERVLDQVFARGGTHGHILQLGLEVDHVIDGNEMNAPALLRRKKC